MSDSQTPSTLNDVLVETIGSLLQYVGETWPWTDVSAEEERAQIQQLIERQRRDIHALIDLQLARSPHFEPGTYPTEYTDLHFVALDSLKAALVENQQDVVATIEAVREACEEDAELAALLDDVLASEQEVLKGLESIQK